MKMGYKDILEFINTFKWLFPKLIDKQNQKFIIIYKL